MIFSIWNSPIRNVSLYERNENITGKCHTSHKMIIERNKNEIMVRFNAGKNASKVQAILNYLRYVELTADSKAKQAEVDNMLKESKKNRWHEVKNQLGLNE